MSLSYVKLSRRPETFRRMTGVTLSEFSAIAKRTRPQWQSTVERQKKCAGRNNVLKTFEDKLMALCLYYRTYVTHEFIGYLCGLHNSNVCRLFKKLEPILGKRLPIQRPCRAHDRKKTYSGKKKRHTRKVEMIMQDNGKIVCVSKSHVGKKHDFRIRKEERPLPRESHKYVDSGYQGLQKIASNVTLAFKRKKGTPLTKEQKAHNKHLSSVRIKIEHKFREIKIFKIMSDTYRNFGKKHHLRFNIIAGIVNLKHGF